MKVKEIQTKSILTKSGAHHGFTANPYNGCTHQCVYCYARYLPDWTGHEGERWGEYVDVKNWEPLTDKQKKNLNGKSVFISSATDPYQPLELYYKRTRKLLEELNGTGADVLVVTKSSYILRDIDILKELNATVALSINTLDDGFRADMDQSVPVDEKLKTLEELYKSGLYTVCFISPIFPAITDAPSIINAVTGKCDEIYLEHLVLSGNYKGPVLYYIKTRYPEYYDFYDRIFNKKELDLWWSYDGYMEDWAKKNDYEYSYNHFPKEHRKRPVITNLRGHKGK